MLRNVRLFPVFVTIALLLAVSTLSAQAQTADPTVTPDPLAEPSEGSYQVLPEGRIVRWRDNATGEEGYRLTVVGATEQVFELPANSEEFRIPDDVQPNACGGIRIDIRAFLGDAESDATPAGIIAACSPPTPSATAALAQLPRTGAGPTHSSGSAFLLLSAFGAGAAAMIAGSVRLALRR
jgi:hypothetical protein